jgi:hypothetical protein
MSGAAGPREGSPFVRAAPPTTDDQRTLRNRDWETRHQKWVYAIPPKGQALSADSQ